MITRRRFLATIGVNLLATPLALEAQQPVRVHRIGFLAGPTLPTSDSDGFRQGLREYGYVEGQNLLLEWRAADGRDDRLPGFATIVGTLHHLSEPTTGLLCIKPVWIYW